MEQRKTLQTGFRNCSFSLFGWICVFIPTMKQPLDRLFQCQGYTVSSDTNIGGSQSKKKCFHSWIRAPQKSKRILVWAHFGNSDVSQWKTWKNKTTNYPTFRFITGWCIAILIFWAVNQYVIFFKIQGGGTKTPVFLFLHYFFLVYLWHFRPCLVFWKIPKR